jgi:hypothetical protein
MSGRRDASDGVVPVWHLGGDGEPDHDRGPKNRDQ